nr:glycosyltransferase family 4 protein [Motilibacter deserti]
MTGKPASERPLRILVTLPDVAWPLDGGKRLRCAGVLRALSRLGEVDVALLFSSSSAQAPPVPPDVVVRRWLRASPPTLPRPRAVLASVSRRVPVHVGAQRWDVVGQQLSPWLTEEYDLAWYGGLDHAWALKGHVRARRHVVDCDDVETEKWKAYLAARGGSGSSIERLQRRIELPWWQRIQDDVLRWSDAVIVCSSLDRARLGNDRKVHVVPNTYPRPTAVRRAPSGPPRMTMIANYQTDQNVDAAEYAVREVLPELRRRMPDARLRLVGRDAQTIEHLRGAPGLDLVGPVDDVATELARATVAVVPMRFGGGTRLKILEAFAHRVPVVSTSLGCEGLGARDGEHLLIRDDAATFAVACHDLCTDEQRAAGLVARGEQLYEAGFTPDAAVAAVREAVAPLL